MKNLNKAFSRWKEVIAITALLRILLFILPLFHPGGFSNLFTPWVHWDGPHYIEIAKNGYQTSGEPALFIVFYPLYPFLIKIISFFIQDFYASSIIISVFFSFVASIFLYELVLLDFNKRVALLSVWFLNIFPTSYFLQASYTESLFLATSISTIFFFRKNLFFESALAGILSTLIRVNGILLLPVLILESKREIRSFISILITPVGFITYIVTNKVTFGEFFYFTKPLSENWFKRLDSPVNGIKNLVESLPTRAGEYFLPFRFELVFIFLTLFLSFYVFLKLRKSYGVYMFLNWLLFTSTSFILSIPRYTLILFPIYIVLAQIKNKIILICLSIISFSTMVYFAFNYTGGKWAF